MSQPREFDAIVAGYTGVDLAPAFADAAPQPLAQLLRPGKLIEIGPLDITPGGVVPNTGLAMAAFGTRVALMGLIGEDRLGDLLLGLLDGRGAALHLRRTRAAGTAYGFVLAPPGTDRIFLECPGVNATFGADDVDYDLVARSRLFHFGYPPLMPRMCADDGAELAAMLQRVRGLGVATSLDMTLPDPQGPTGATDWRALLARVLPHVDIFTPSLEELLVMLAPEEWSDDLDADAVPLERCEALAEAALALGCRIVLMKLGARGGLLFSGDVGDVPLGLAPDTWGHQRLRLPAFAVAPSRLCNACGAGDAAVGAFLTALLQGEDAASAGRLAMLAGRDSLYGVDTTSGLRAWDAMQAEACASAPQ